MNHFVLRHQRGLTFAVCEPLEKLGFLNAFSTRLTNDVTQLNEFTLGHSDPRQRHRIVANRRQFINAIDAAHYQLVTARQIHSATILSVSEATELNREPPTGDALTGSAEGILLGIQTADCLSVLMVDPQMRVFANLHAGWRSTLQEIVALTVTRMRKEYRVDPQNLHVAFGSAICAKHFEVGPEVIEQFRHKFPDADQFISRLQPHGKGHLDLALCNTQQLLAQGVGQENIYDSGYCTIAQNDLFFSYRRERGHERAVGRLLTVVGRKESHDQ